MEGRAVGRCEGHGPEETRPDFFLRAIRSAVRSMKSMTWKTSVSCHNNDNYIAGDIYKILEACVRISKERHQSVSSEGL